MRFLIDFLAQIRTVPGGALLVVGPLLFFLIPAVIMALRARNKAIVDRLGYAHIVLVGGLSVQIILATLLLVVLDRVFGSFGVFDRYNAMPATNSEDYYRRMLEAQFYLGACGFLCAFPWLSTVRRSLGAILDGEWRWVHYCFLAVPTVIVGVAFLILARL